MTPCIRPGILACVLVPALLMAAPALAQSLSFTSNDPDKPIEVTADQGIEWQQNDKLFIARGNAKAKQDDMSVTADELTAHYRETTNATRKFTALMPWAM